MSLFDALPRGPSSGGAAVPFGQEDLTRVFDTKTLQRGRTLIDRQFARRPSLPCLNRSARAS